MPGQSFACLPKTPKVVSCFCFRSVGAEGCFKLFLGNVTAVSCVLTKPAAELAADVRHLG